MIRDFPAAKIIGGLATFQNGTFCELPSEYSKPSNDKVLQIFYSKLLKNTPTKLVFGIDSLGFNYFQIGLICYVGLICENTSRSTYNNLKKKFPKNKFNIDYIKKRIEEEHKLLNFQEYIPIEAVAQNLHEIRGLNAKISDNLDYLLKFDSEESWDEQFEASDPHLRKIYVASRLTKFILDNTKFYNPDFWETLVLNKDRYLTPHRSVSKIVKIYRNDFKKDKPDISFNGFSTRKIQGDKEYFEILIKILIENAFKYSTIKSIGPKVEIFESKQSIIISVSSYGKLIPDDDKRKVFLKGYRSNVNKKSIDGTGMGLYNAKKLTEKFSGTIVLDTKKATSEADLGWNTFKLTFNQTFHHDKSAFA